MSDKPSEYKPKIDAVDSKVTAALREAITTVKMLIARKNILYSVDASELDFKALEELGKDYEKASGMAAKAGTLSAGCLRQRLRCPPTTLTASERSGTGRGHLQGSARPRSRGACPRLQRARRRECWMWNTPRSTRRRFRANGRRR